jgi:hypothetical protein
MLLELLTAKGMPVKVTSALPYVARDEDGQRIGLVHWFEDRGTIWVSQQTYEQLKKLPQSNVPQCGTDDLNKR